MTEFLGAQKEPNDMVALAKSWAAQQLLYSPERPFSSSYPRNSAVRTESHSDIALGLAPFLQPEKSLALLDFVAQEATLAQSEYTPDDQGSFSGWLLVGDALCNVVTGYLKIEAYNHALQTAQMINDEVQQVEMIANVASVLFQKGHFEAAQVAYARAEQAANAIDNIYIQYEARSVLLHPTLQIKGVEWAVSLSEKVESQGDANIPRFYALIRHLIGMERITDAQRVARVLNGKVPRAKALSEIAVGYAKIGKQHLSKVIILELEEYLKTTNDPEDQLYLLCSLSVALYQTGNIPRSNDLLSRASELAHQMLHTHIPTPVFDYAMALAACGYYDRAREEVLAIMPASMCSETLLRLIKFLDDHLNIDEAYKTVGLLDTKYLQARMLIRLVKTLLSIGQREQAHEFLNEVIVLLNAFDFTHIQPLDHYLVTQMLVGFNRIPEAFQYLDRAGIDEFLKALSNASLYFEKVDQGLAQKVIKSVIEIAVQKHPDYEPILKLIS